MITRTKKQLLSEMVQNAGVDPKKILGDDAEIEGDPEEAIEPVAEAMYKVPRSKKDLAPKTPANLKKRADLAKSAVAHVEAAIKDLSKIPPLDFMGDIYHFSELLDQAIGGDGGGLKWLAKAYDRDAKKGK